MKRLMPALLLLVASSISAEPALTHLTNIYRAPQEVTLLAGGSGYHTLTYPQYLGVFANYLYFTQSGSNQLFRYDMNTELLSVINSVSAEVSGAIGCVTVRMDFGFFICDESSNRVLSFDAQGNLVNSYASFGNLVKPISVIESVEDRSVLVSDGLFDHVVVFSPTGEAIRVIGSRGENDNEFMNIQDSDSQDDMIYILDRLSDKVKTFSFSGSHIQSHERAEVKMPSSIAVDQFRRIYVSDEYDDTLKIYRDGKLVETYGRTGTRDGEFSKITDMKVYGAYMYVADTNNGRIQVFVINTPEIKQ